MNKGPNVFFVDIFALFTLKTESKIWKLHTFLLSFIRCTFSVSINFAIPLRNHWNILLLCASSKKAHSNHTVSKLCANILSSFSFHQYRSIFIQMLHYIRFLHTVTNATNAKFKISNHCSSLLANTLKTKRWWKQMNRGNKKLYNIYRWIYRIVRKMFGVGWRTGAVSRL